MSSAPLSRGELLAYAAFALPLAMAALPVYVHAPTLYGDNLGLSLALVGVILPAARLLDAIQDPFLGWLSDRSAASTLGRGLLVVFSLPLLAAGMLALFHPPASSQAVLAVWLGLSLVVVQLGFSMGFSRRPAVMQPSHERHGIYAALLQTLRNRRYRWLIGITLSSGIAAAIPGTLILFYVQDVLQRPALSGLFLVLYFVFAAAGMPLWIAAARRLGKKPAWLVGMFCSVAAFIWAFLLGSGDVIPCARAATPS